VSVTGKCRKALWETALPIFTILRFLFYLFLQNNQKQNKMKNKNDSATIEKKDFHRTITVNASAEEAFEKIAKVGDWWAKSFTGKALNPGDTFRVEFGTTWVNFKVSEAIPGKKIVWYVTDSYLPWLKDKTEWNNTKVMYEISSDGHKTVIDFTHIGLQPQIECYENCEKGWTRFATISLPRFINEGKGLPE